LPGINLTRALWKFSASARRSSRCVCRGCYPAINSFAELVLRLSCGKNAGQDFKARLWDLGDTQGLLELRRDD